MESKPIEEMSEQEFDTLLDKIADAEFDKLTPSAFLDAVWALKARQAEEVIEVTVEVVGDELHFEPGSALPVRGNEIFLAGKRVIVKLKRPVSTMPVK
ncbi:MAG: hypothetical protein L0229_18710 [Blastocatellia bacterium]|nr:hypothetical protein [Blastocatellia bacterium]